jgi:hypothetical protein
MIDQLRSGELEYSFHYGWKDANCRDSCVRARGRSENPGAAAAQVRTAAVWCRCEERTDKATGKKLVRGRDKGRRSVAAEHPVPGRRRVAPERGDAPGFPLIPGRRPRKTTAPVLSQGFLRRSREALQEASDLLAHHLTHGDAAGADLLAPVQPGHGQSVSQRLPAAVPAEAGGQAGERGARPDRRREQSEREDEGPIICRRMRNSDGGRP